MMEELQNHPELLAEAYQSYLRFKKIPGAYEILKDKTRGKTIELKDLHELVDTLDLSNQEKQKMRNLKVENYLGYASELTKNVEKYL